MYPEGQLPLSHDEDGILLREGSAGDGGIVKNEGPVSYEARQLIDL